MLRWPRASLSVLSCAKSVSAPSRNGARPFTVSTTVAASSPEDTSRYYVAQTKERFHDGRYEAVRPIGTGRYSHVWLARDLHNRSLVALKLLNSDCYGTAYDIFELEILQATALRQAVLEKGQISHVVQLHNTFRLPGPARAHECIVMPVLGCDIDDQARRFPQRRVSVNIMKEITRQLLTGVEFMHEKCKVIHTDLHPSNICFEVGLAQTQRMVAGKPADEVTPIITERQPGTIRIIDFGVASWIDKHLSDNIQPEHLKAPEVILGASWGTSVDIWSLGCLVVELVKGQIAFPGDASQRRSRSSEDEQLAQYMEVLGPMPSELLERGTKTSTYFDGESNLLRIPRLGKMDLTAYIDGSIGPLERPKEMEDEDVPVFLDFIRGALTLDARHRKTAKALLQHEWLRDV